MNWTPADLKPALWPTIRPVQTIGSRIGGARQSGETVLPALAWAAEPEATPSGVRDPSSSTRSSGIQPSRRTCAFASGSAASARKFHGYITI